MVTDMAMDMDMDMDMDMATVMATKRKERRKRRSGINVYSVDIIITTITIQVIVMWQRHKMTAKNKE